VIDGAPLCVQSNRKVVNCENVLDGLWPRECSGKAGNHMEIKEIVGGVGQKMYYRMSRTTETWCIEKAKRWEASKMPGN